MILNKIFKSEFSKNIAFLASSSFLTQGINFIFNVFLARIYLPEYFGTLSVFITIVGFISVLAAGKFDVALVATTDDSDSKKLFTLSFLILISVSIITLIGVSIIYLLDVNIYKGQPVHDWFYFIVLSMIFITGSQVFWMLNVRDKNFKNISYVRIAEAFTTGLLSLLLFKLAAKGLLFGTMAGQMISFILLSVIVLRKFPLSSLRFSVKELKETFIKYIEFPKINILQGFLDMFQMGILVLFLSKYYTPEVTGFYSQCMRVLQIPMRLLVLPVSHVFFAEASERYRNNISLYPLVKKTIIKSFLYLLPVPLILIAFGPLIFSIAFGSVWNEAGVYARILSFWIFFELIRAPIIQIASIIGKQKQILFFAIANAMVFTIVIFASSKSGLNVRNTLLLVSISQVVMNIVVVLYLLKISRLKLNEH
jgi:O-antigen/teichoic acid export membrane protein